MKRKHLYLPHKCAPVPLVPRQAAARAARWPQTVGVRGCTSKGAKVRCTTMRTAWRGCRRRRSLFSAVLARLPIDLLTFSLRVPLRVPRAECAPLRFSVKNRGSQSSDLSPLGRHQRRPPALLTAL